MAGGRALTYVPALDTESEETRMSVPETTLSVPLAALPDARAAAAPGAPAIADDVLQLDNAAFADRVARAPRGWRASASARATSSRSP